MQVLMERSGKVCTIILNRPEMKNVVNKKIAQELADAFRQFEQDDRLHVAVLWGKGGAFCAGADLKALATIASMLGNATMILVEKFSSTVFWQDIKNYGVSHFHAVGPILEMLLKQQPTSLETEHGPLTAIAYSSKEVWTEAQERFQISITGGYGSTEVGIPVSAPYSVVQRRQNPPGSCGLVGPHVEVKLMDEQGRLVEALPRTATGRIEKFKLKDQGITPYTFDLEGYRNERRKFKPFV